MDCFRVIESKEVDYIFCFEKKVSRGFSRMNADLHLSAKSAVSPSGVSRPEHNYFRLGLIKIASRSRHELEVSINKISALSQGAHK
jgi:hypothetical protein